MFTGLVEAVTPVLALEPRGAGASLVLSRPDCELEGGPFEVALGDSLACSGCCLTLARMDSPGAMEFDLSAETLARTWFAAARPGRLVNLERALSLADRLGGHLVSGHVDGLGRVAGDKDTQDGGRLFTFEVPASCARWLIHKGSVAVDGISLTVIDPRPAGEGDANGGALFDVAVIPKTLAWTNLGKARPGDCVHLEGDMIGKWVEHLIVPWRDGTATPGSSS